MNKVKVAIVILNWNGKRLLEQFLPSVTRYSNLPGMDIFVADNASTDDSVAFLKLNYPNIKCIELSENFGFAEGYNQALKQVEAEYYVLLNSDVEVTANWLKPMVDYMDNNADVVAIQPKILAQKQKTHFEYAGASGGYIDKLGFPFCRGRIFDTVEYDHGQYNTIQNIFWASGACMFIRSQDYFEVGGLDARFFAHMEEIDLCWRLRARGKRIVCLPKSTVFHVGAATLKKESPNKVFLNFRNNMLMLYKNLDSEKVNKTIRIRKTYNLIAAVKYVLAGQTDNAKAILKAHKDFNSLKSKYQETRNINIEKTVNKDIAEIYRGNIILDYYLRGKKKFGGLHISNAKNGC